MDITPQVKKGNVSNDFQERGDIIGVFRMPADTSTLNPGVKFYYLHIIGFPDVSQAKARRIRQKLTRHDWVETGQLDEEGAPALALRNSRVWSVPVGALTPGARNAIRQNGELTATWSQVKPYVMQKLRRIARDDSLDNDNYNAGDYAPVTDDDIANA